MRDHHGSGEWTGSLGRCSSAGPLGRLGLGQGNANIFFLTGSLPPLRVGAAPGLRGAVMQDLVISFVAVADLHRVPAHRS